MVWCSDTSFHVFFRQNTWYDAILKSGSIMVVMQQPQPQPTTVPVCNVCSTQCKFTTLFTNKTCILGFFFFLLLLSPEIPSLADM